MSVIAASCACAGAAGDRKIEAQEMARLRAVLVDRLRDAESAKFRGEFLSLKDDDDQVRSLCGQVNARNGYGGFTGFVGFVVTSKGLVVTGDESGGANFGAIWDVWCARPTKG